MKKTNFFISLALVSLSLLFLFLPIFKIRVYSVYLWDLSRTEIDSHSLTIFDVIFGNIFFKAEPLCVLFIIIPIISVLFLLLSLKYTKYHNHFLIGSMVTMLLSIVLMSYSNSFYTNIIGCKPYLYQEELLKISNGIIPVSPESTSHRISYWIDLDLGSFLCIIFNSISLLIIFVENFLLSKDKRKPHS